MCHTCYKTVTKWNLGKSHCRNAVSSSTGLQQGKQHTTPKANPHGFRIKCGMTLPHFIAKPEHKTLALDPNVIPQKCGRHPVPRYGTHKDHSIHPNRHTAGMRYPVARNIAKTHKKTHKEIARKKTLPLLKNQQ